MLLAAVEIAAASANDRRLVADLWRRAVDGLRESVGDEHPATLTSMNNLAESLRGLDETPSGDAG